MESALKTQILIDHVQNGSKEALSELCERYMPRILYAVRARLGQQLRRKLQSMDVVQDAMVDIVNGIDNFEFRSDGAFLHYVNRIIENNIRDEAAKYQAAKRDIAKEQQMVAVNDGSQREIDIADYRGSDTPSKQLARLEDLSRLERAMDVLAENSPEYHELIIQTKLEGLSYSEIAENAGASADAVRMKINRARKHLAKIFLQLEKECV